MAHASFGTGWPDCDRRNIVTLVRRDGLRLPVHRDLADLVSLLLDCTEVGLGYNVRPDWTWGYACRPIASTSTPSNHSWGTAIDINAPANPRRKRGLPMVTDLPRSVVQLWRDHGFRWGGDFSWPDPMHFEFMGTAQQARATAARLRAFLGGAPPPPAPVDKPRPVPYPEPGRVWGRGDEGQGVRVIQDVLRQRGYPIAVDGDYGPATEAAVRDWQRNHPPLRVDGRVGPATWHQLLFA